MLRQRHVARLASAPGTVKGLQLVFAQKVVENSTIITGKMERNSILPVIIVLFDLVDCYDSNDENG